MILKELCDYYDVVASDHENHISPYGYETSNASYVAVLSKEGKLMGLKMFADSNGKPEKRSFMVPIRMKIKGIAASPVLDNFDYLFGVGGEKGVKTTERVKFETAKKLHVSMFRDGTSEESLAIVRFFEQWDLAQAWENEHILSVYSEKGNAFSGNVVFQLLGETKYFHEAEEICHLWLAENERKENEKNLNVRQCSITGEILPIAQLHPQFGKVKGASTMGASLVCFNKDSDLSYNLEQSFNAAVSQKATFKYSTALRYMLEGNNQKMYVGDDTVVFWASSSNPSYAAAFDSFFNPPDDDNDKKDDNTKKVNREMESQVEHMLQDANKGVFQDSSDLDPNVQFCVLGLSPNAGRISVRYFYKDTFGHFCHLLMRHHHDMKIEGKRPFMKVGSLLYATISSNSKDKKVNPLLGGAIVRAILTGKMYPQILLNQIVLRCKTESHITQARAAAIKGFLVRKARITNKEEDITMSLNEQSTNTAYVLGRTFAILEKIQKDALGDINSTIKDKYFASACSNPSLVFPNLLKLTQHHLAKIEGFYLSRKLADCLSLVEGETFPKTLNMENQGRFILGYYQQNQNLYTKQQPTKGENK